MLSATPLPATNAASRASARSDALFPLKVRDVFYSRREKHLLDGINLTIESDQITLIMGPNGAGKSLLVRLLHGLEPATSGEIFWGETPVGAAVRKRQALVFQRPVLLRRSVGENIDFVLRLKDQPDLTTRNALLDRVGLRDFANRPARLLSGGEQQRLALARALASEPDILFLDEPTANLDPASTQIIEDIVQAQKSAGTKIIFVTHDIAQARRLGGEIVFLHRGRVSEHRPAAEFFNHPQSLAAQDYLAGRIVL